MRWLAAAAAAAALALAGCAPHSDYMLDPATPPSHVPTPNRATVIFLRPSAMGLLAKYMIVDSERHFLGDSLAQSKFAVMLPPGEHWFVAYHETDPIARSDAMHVTLLPGRIYFVEVAPNLAGVQLLAISPRHDNWKEVRSWLADTTELIPDVPAGQANLDEDPESVDVEIQNGLGHLQDEDDDGRAERTLLPDDGISSE